MPRARRVTRSLRPWHSGDFLQAPAPAYLLVTGVLCPVDCPALLRQAQTQLLSCSKVPSGAPEPHCTHRNFLGSIATWYRRWIWSIAESYLARPVGTWQWESRHPWAVLAGVRVWGEASGQGRSWGAQGALGGGMGLAGGTSGDIQDYALQGQRDSFPSQLAV